jgi:formylglycine-generating enzyme required for sulfatase activity
MAFDVATWRDEVRALVADFASDPQDALARAGVTSLYGFLLGSTVLPVVATYAAGDPGNAVVTLTGVVGGLGANLIANLVQKKYDDANVITVTAQEAQSAELAPVYEAMAEKVEVIKIAEEELGKAGQIAVLEQLRAELRQLGKYGQFAHAHIYVEQSGGVNLGVGNQIRSINDIVARDKHEHHYHGPTNVLDAETLLREYLRSLSGECNRLSLADADSRDPTHAAVELASVYTGLEVARRVGFSQESGTPERHERALESVSAQPRLVLLGDPGSGKSTFVNFITLCLAQAWLGVPGWIERLGADWAHGPLVPVRVVLRECAAWVAAQPPPPARGTAQTVWQWLAERHGDALVSVLRRELDAGRVILLFDGLDEVPAGADGQSLAVVRQILEDVRHVAWRGRVLVTCRALDYQDSQRQLAGWSTERLIPFSEPLRRAFIQHWYQVLAQLDRPLNGTPDTLSTQLLTAMHERSELRRLAGNPLLLTMMTLLHSYAGRLPDERVQLYEQCIEMLLYRWRANHGESALQMQLDLVAWRPRDLHDLLDRLGYVAHQQGGSDDGEAGTDLPRPLLMETARAFFASYDPDRAYGRAEVLCQYVSRHSNGVLQQYGPDIYRFPHRTFQEYLAARRLTSDEQWSDREAEFVDRALARTAEGSQWRETVMLAISRLVVEYKQIRPVVDVAAMLLERHPARTPAWVDDVLLAGDALVEVGRERLARLAPQNAQIGVATANALAETLQSAAGGTLDPTSIDEVRIGTLLGKLGDPRPGVASLPPLCVPMAGASVILGNTPEDRDGWVQWGVWDARRGEGLMDHFNQQRRPTTVAPFAMARYPITNAQYASFIAEQGYDANQLWWDAAGRAWLLRDDTNEDVVGGLCRRIKHQPEYWDDDTLGVAQSNRPVVGVSWYEACAFCRWLTHHPQYNPEGYHYRLPSDAEWEYAMRGGERRPFAWGWNPPDEALLHRIARLPLTVPVGCLAYTSTPDGIADVVGVAERTRSLMTPGCYADQGDQAQYDGFTDTMLVTRGMRHTGTVAQWAPFHLSRRSPRFARSSDRRLGFRVVREEGSEQDPPA